MKPLLVFDLDGTLIDSGPDIVVALNKTLKDFGVPTLPPELIIAHISEGARNLLKDHIGQTGLIITETEITSAFLANYEKVMLRDTKVYEGVHEFLAAYEGPMGIITNKNVGPAKTIISHLGLHKYPWVEIFGADSLAEKKPSPLPLNKMMRLAGKSADSTFMIGDGLPDVQSAKNAGVRSIAIGFGYTQHDILLEYQPVAILEHYRNLNDLLKTLNF